MSSTAGMEKFQSGIFRKLVLLHMLQALVFSVTGIVDCAVVGRSFGAEGLAGIKLAMPVFSILYLFSTVLSSGLSVQVTQLLAKGERGRANQCLLWVVTTCVGLAVLFLAVAGLVPDALTQVFAGRAEDAVLIQNARSYLLPILYGSLPILLYNVLSAVVAMEGGGRRMTTAVIVVLVSDIIGDLLAVKLDAGIRGVAIASVMAYLCACLVLASQFFTKKTIFRPERLRREKGILTAVLVCGLPMAVRYFCDFLYPVVVNHLMLRYGTVAGLAALSIQDAARYLPIAFCEGLAAAVLLLTGMYGGEQDGEALRRERQSIRRYGLGIGTVWAAALMLLAPLLVLIFTTEGELQILGTSALRWYLVGVPFLGINGAIRAYLQGMGKEKEASLFTMVNMLLLPVIVTWFMARQMGTTGIFAAFAVHEIVLTVSIALWQLRGRAGAKAGTQPAGENRRDVNQHQHRPIIGEEDWSPVSAEVRGTLNGLPEVAAASQAVIDLCLAHGVAPKRAMQMGLCLEELAANSIEHGFAAGKPGYLEYRFLITAEQLILRLRDNGRAFDLTERYELLNPKDPASHIGLRLVFASADSVSYSHAFNLNNICIRSAR